MVEMQSMVEEARNLPLVPLVAVEEYQSRGSRLISLVDGELTRMVNINEIIGNNSPQLMYDNHKHHWAFMSTVFGIGGYELLARTLPWIYRTYHSHGFTYDYFPVELNAWKKAIQSEIAERTTSQILAVYDWMIDSHQQIIDLAESDAGDVLPVSENWLEIKNTFRAKLLEGDFAECMKIAQSYTRDSTGLKDLYLQIIQPSMYEIGQMWERAEISVAQEHLASAVVSRIMACVNGEIELSPKDKGKAVITAAPGEFHEIGAWMISDILEQDGWQVVYLGANTPDSDLLQLLDQTLPDILALSVTMPFNLDRAKVIIDTLREKPIHCDLKILVGGRVFIDNPELENIIGADGFAANIDTALKITRGWCNK